jgi:hypothetical protein
LLHKDPTKRPSIARALQHPFFTGQKVVRMAGDAAEWDVFISYRVASDAKIAEALHSERTKLGLRVFYDKVCLRTGQEWRDGFFDGLVKSRLFLPIISRGAIKTVDASNNNVWGNWEALTASSGCDNVLLEHRAALECRDRGLLEAVVPLFVGDETAPPSGIRGEYFKGGCEPKPADVVVASVEAELISQLDRAGLGTPYANNVTSKKVFELIKGFQGASLENEEAKSLLVACDSIAKVLSPAPAPLSSPRSPSSFVVTSIVSADGSVTYVSSTGQTFVLI